MPRTCVKEAGAMGLITICEQELWTASLCTVGFRCSVMHLLQMLARVQVA